jgi:gamma-glutamyl phosphate reductase
MSDLQTHYDETHELLEKANKRIAEFEVDLSETLRQYQAVAELADSMRDENERLRGENAMLLASADADAVNLNTLQRCCCMRGARMQKMYSAIQDCTYPDSMEKEFSAWFDEDGVPID